MSGDSCIECKAFLSFLQNLQVNLYVYVSCIALLVFDHLHTLPLEVQYVWSSRLSLATVLYYITKYGAYTIILDLYYHFSHSPLTPEQCHGFTWVFAYLSLISFWAGEALLGLRVWAVWGKDRRLTLALPIIFLALCTLSLVFLGTFVGSMQYVPSPVPQISTCFVVKTNQDLIKNMICLSAWVILTFILMITSAVRAYQTGGNSEFTQMVYREGLIYYTYSFILRVGGIILFYVAPPQLSFVIAIPSRFFDVALTSRVLLHTREYGSKCVVIVDRSGDEELRWTTTEA